MRTNDPSPIVKGENYNVHRSIISIHFPRLFLSIKRIRINLDAYRLHTLTKYEGMDRHIRDSKPNILKFDFHHFYPFSICLKIHYFFSTRIDATLLDSSLLFIKYGVKVKSTIIQLWD